MEESRGNDTDSADVITGEEEQREDGEAFWINVRRHLELGAVTAAYPGDKSIVYALAGGQKARGWISMIPRGLLSSYRYLYDCVKGLGCEDADIIERDVLRTVGAVKDGPGVFGDTSDHGKAGKARAMHRVLTAISITDSMGYCQGMNYVVDFLLKMVDEVDAFCLFLYALRNKHLCCLYETKLPVLSDYMEIYERQLGLRAPELSNHLKERGFIAPFYSIEWFTTLFMLSCPFELTVAIWDLFFMGFKDVQMRCALALMESVEPFLIMMGTEELLKNFRTVAVHQVKPLDVILRALRIDLAPVKVGSSDLYGQPTANGVNQENHNYSNVSGNHMDSAANSNIFVIDPRGKVKDDDIFALDSGGVGAASYTSGSNLHSDILLTLRLRYLRKAREAMHERDADTGRWAQEQLQRGQELLQQQQKQREEEENDSCVSFPQENEGVKESQNSEVKKTRSLTDDEGDDVAGELVERPSSSNVSKLRESVDGEVDQSSGDTNLKQAFSVTNYFEFLVDGELMNRAYALKEVVASCDRIAQWVLLNQKWADCLEFMESKLSQYNLADHMLRYAITINAHIRVISFFLAVAGADPNSQDRWLRTPLHFAAAHNRPDVVRVLLLAGADYSIPGALNKCISVAPTYSSVSGALKSGRMITPTVLCQATYGNSLASYPAALTILKGKSCILCNGLESASVPVAKRRSSKARIVLNGLSFPSVHTSLRSSEGANVLEVSTSHSSTSKVIVISNCQKCNMPMCTKCVSDHHCIADIIEEEFTWKVKMVKKSSKVSAPRDEDVDTSQEVKVVNGSSGSSSSSSSSSSKRRSTAIRDLGEKLLMRRPSFLQKKNNNSDDSGDSVCSGDLVSSDDEAAEEETGGAGSENKNKIVENSDHDQDDIEDRDVSSKNLGEMDASHTSAITVSHEDLTLTDSEKAAQKGVSKSPRFLKKLFNRETSTSSETSNSSDVRNANTKLAKKKSIRFTGLFKEKSKSNVNNDDNIHEEENVQPPKGGMPMYWIGYRDEVDRQATLQPWQIVLLPLVQGGEYVRVLDRSGRLFPAEEFLETQIDESGEQTVAGTLSKPTLKTGPDSDDEIDLHIDNLTVTNNLDVAGRSRNSSRASKMDGLGDEVMSEEEDERIANDENIHKQVREIYFDSFKFQNKQTNANIRAKEPQYLYFVSEMEGLYRILGRDAKKIFAIEPLPSPPPMITSVTGSYLHAKHHSPRKKSNRKKFVPSATNTDHDKSVNLPQPSINKLISATECWDGITTSETGRWIDTSDLAKSSGLGNHSTTNIVIPALKSLSVSYQDSLRIDINNRNAYGESDAKEDVETRFQQQLQLKGMNGLKKEALKRFLSGSWTLNEDDDLWVPDECAWYCRKCSEQFSIFKRKHHCRRCGNVFCDEDAPRVDASECLHESLQQAYQGVLKEELAFGKKREKTQFRLCTSCKNEIRHSIGLYIELDFLLPRYNFSTWLISLLSKTYNNMSQTTPAVEGIKQGGDSNSELKNVKLKKFAVAGHWMDSMADWLWRDRQLQLDNT